MNSSNRSWGGGAAGGAQRSLTPELLTANRETEVQREEVAGVGSSQLGSQAPVIASKVQRDRIGDGLEARRPEAISRAHILLSFGTLSAEHLSPICTVDMRTSLNDAMRIRRDHSFNTPNAKQLLKTVLSLHSPPSGFTQSRPVFRN